MAKEKINEKYKPEKIKQDKKKKSVYYSDSDIKAFRKRRERKKKLKLRKENRKYENARRKK